MEKNLREIFGNQVLPEEVQLALMEAWDQKIQEVKKETEEKVREELGKRYRHDKEKIVNAMEKFLEENFSKEVALLAEAKKKVKDEIEKEKQKVREEYLNELKALKESVEKVKNEKEKELEELRHTKKKALENSKKVVENFLRFATEKLTEEIKEFNEDKKELKNKVRDLDKKIKESRESYRKAFENRAKMLRKFVLGQLEEEIREFNNDRKILEKRRVRLETTANKKIKEIQKKLVKKASDLVRKIVLQNMNREMRQLKEDLRIARENNFGRKLFEAFASEYMASFFSENSQIKKLQNRLNNVRRMLSESKEKLNEKDREITRAYNKIKVYEEKIERMKILNELLAPLSKEQRRIMSNLLENVKNEKLKEAFRNYLPSVLGGSKVEKTINKDVIVENLEDVNVSIVTGDKKNIITEEIQKEDTTVIHLKKLAGL